MLNRGKTVREENTIENQKPPNLRAFPIVCQSFTPWEANYAKSTTQIISRLAIGHPILYMDYPFTIKDVLASLFGKSSMDVKRIFGLKKRLRKIKLTNDAEIYCLSLPPIFPVNWLPTVGWFKKGLWLNNKIVSFTLKGALSQLGWAKPLLFNAYNPFYGIYLSQSIPFLKRVYYCYDEIAGSPWSSKYGSKIEEIFLNIADVVIVSSDTLKESKSILNQNTLVIKNGVDFKLFNVHAKKEFNFKTKNEEQEQPPIIGYAGSIDERLDYDLLRFLAEHQPDYNFRLVGRIVFPELISDLKKLKNVEILAPVPYQEVAKVMAEFDLALIPFLKTEFTKNIYPLKINEYLSLGLPVLMTDFAELPEFDELVKTASSPSEFLKGLIKELEENDQEKIAKRIEWAKQNSWENRVDRLEEILTDAMTE